MNVKTAMAVVLTACAGAFGDVQPAVAEGLMQRLVTASPLAVLSELAAERGSTTRSGIAYGPHPRHQLDVYEPDAGRERRRPVVLFFYGGAWTTGDRGLYAYLGAALASRGYTTVIADYRLYPEVAFPAFVEDAARAYGWVDRNLSAEGRRPIVVMGHSAGAHIGALLTLDTGYLARLAPKARQPGGFIGLAGPYAFDPTTWPTTSAIFAPAARKPDVARPTASAARFPGVPPPALLMHGSGDTVVTPNASAALRDALARRGGKVRHIELSIGHIGIVLAYARPLRWQAGVLQPTLDFLARLDAKG